MQPHPVQQPLRPLQALKQQSSAFCWRRWWGVALWGGKDQSQQEKQSNHLSSRLSKQSLQVRCDKGLLLPDRKRSKPAEGMRGFLIKVLEFVSYARPRAAFLVCRSNIIPSIFFMRSISVGITAIVAVSKEKELDNVINRKSWQTTEAEKTNGEDLPDKKTKMYNINAPANTQRNSEKNQEYELNGNLPREVFPKTKQTSGSGPSNRDGRKMHLRSGRSQKPVHKN